jgi:Uma2 family endonuclease
MALNRLESVTIKRSPDNGSNAVASATIVEIEYPESDGRPMGETDLHREWMIRILDLLGHHFRGQRVYVSGDLLVYYVEGVPTRFVVPDAFVVKDCDSHQRRTYKIWEEGKPPDVVLETTSKSTQHVDLVHKAKVFAEMGVAEYFLYDPTGDYLTAQLLGYRRNGGGFVPIEPDESGAIECRELGLLFRLEVGDLVMYVKETGERLLTSDEREVRARELAEQAQMREQHFRAREQLAREGERQARADAEREATARRAVEAELARLRGESARRLPSDPK